MMKDKKKTQEIVCILCEQKGFLSISGIVGLNSMWELQLNSLKNFLLLAKAYTIAN